MSDIEDKVNFCCLTGIFFTWGIIRRKTECLFCKKRLSKKAVKAIYERLKDRDEKIDVRVELE